MPEATLFPLGSRRERAAAAPVIGAPRLARPVRNQIEMLCADLNSLLPEEHEARTVWAFAEKSDLSAWYAKIQAVEGGVGRAATDPQLLLALWLYATLDGVGSARGLAKLCEAHVAYRWLCGGVPVNYHTLADFRSESSVELDALLTEMVARLRAAGAVTLNRVAHDGMRVRASAGSGSFRRLETLEHFRQEAAEQVATLRLELEADAGAGERRRQAAQERARRERLARVEEALRQYPEVKAKKKQEKSQARVSTTDPDARTMRMPDGGFRPAYNVQLTTDTASQVVVHAAVIQSGSDHGQLPEVVKEVERRSGLRPRELLADGGFAKPEDIEVLAKGVPACIVYAPPTEFKTPAGHVKPPGAEESAELGAWRARMRTAEGREIYKERAATIECVNAQARNRGLQQFRVRGAKRVQAVVLLFALAHNLMCMVRLLGTVC